MAKKASTALCLMIGCLIVTGLNGAAALGIGDSQGPTISDLPSGHYAEHLQRMQALKARTLGGDRVPRAAPAATDAVTSPSAAPAPDRSGSRVYCVTSYGADPTGQTDSTDAVLEAVSGAVNGSGGARSLSRGITDLGGARISLDGGVFTISRPLRFPSAAIGNLEIYGGTLHASEDFPADGYLIELTTPSSANASAPSSSSSYDFEYITLRDLFLDSNYRAGGVSVVNALRTGIDNCYVARFATAGIHVQGGHETYIRNSFLGQHITAGGDPGERSFSGTAIRLMGNDNAVTDVVIFSAAVGVLVAGQANSLSGVHCYNKATGFGGTGIYLKLPRLTQTRILNCYLDYTGIVAEDPVQLHISGSFFLGDAFVLLKSVNGVSRGVNIVDNMFSGGGKGVAIVQLDETGGAFTEVDQVVVDRNSVEGMCLKSTVARGSAAGNGTTWTVDFGHVLLFPDRIRHVQYSVRPERTGVFPSHVIRNISNNRVIVESNVAVPATVFVTAEQGTAAARSS